MQGHHHKKLKLDYKFTTTESRYQLYHSGTLVLFP